MPTTTREVSAAFPGSGLTFSYPRTWTLTRIRRAGMVYAGIAYLSSRPTQAPCPPQDHVDCAGHQPRPLRPGGLLIHWYAWGTPAITLATQPGRPATIGGHPAHVWTGRAVGLCHTVHGSRTVQAWITQSPATGNGQLIEMTACLSGSAQTAAVQSLLKSVHLPT